MGRGGNKGEMREIAETRAAGRDAAFEGILAKVEAAGGEITKDETTPLYTEVGMNEFEVGHKRIVEFNLNKTDFQLIRKVETHILQGAGHQKHLEELATPRIHIDMKKKSEISSDWQIVDFDELF